MKIRIQRDADRAGAGDHSDIVTPGLSLRVGRRSRTWRYGYRVTEAGKRKWRFAALGDASTMTLAEARAEAYRLAAERRSGIDPVANRRAEEAAERGELTVERAVKRYCDQHVVGLKSADAVRRYFERDLIPELGSVKLKKVRRADIIKLVEDKAASTPRAAALLLTHIKGLFAWAMDRELIEANPAAGIKPAKVNKSMKPRQRARVLDDEEIRALWQNAETCGLHRLTAIALKLVLVTGQRPGEVAGMRWSELDGKVWTIPGSRRLKTETEQRVPLTSTAEELLAQAKAEVGRLAHRRTWEAGDCVFAARPSGGITVNALDRAVARYQEALGNKEQADWGFWTPHDLRRTCRTGLSACGVSEEIAERVIGHGHKGIIATYNQHRYDDEKRAALEAWEQRLLGTVQQSVG